MNEQQRPLRPVEPIGMEWRTIKASRIELDTVWWTMSDLYHFCGATTATRKRTVRRQLQAYDGPGRTHRNGQWYVAEVVARTHWAVYHDDAIRRALAESMRTPDGHVTDIRTFKPRARAAQA